MGQYIYETHLHTVEASACGRVSGGDYIDFMKDRGFAGMFVTDHFFNGNCAVPRGLSWKERVRWYTSGYHKAKEAAAGSGFSVFFGVEFNFDGDEYLLYGIDEDWLLQNDDLLLLSREEVYNRVHEAGGIMIQAHPYRERGYLSDIRLLPGVCDAVEIYNAANEDYQNALAYRYAVDTGKIMTAGSDIHFFHDDALGGMLFERKIESEDDFVRAVMSNEGIPVRLYNKKTEKVTDLKEQTTFTKEPTLPVIWL